MCSVDIVTIGAGHNARDNPAGWNDGAWLSAYLIDM